MFEDIAREQRPRGLSIFSWKAIPGFVAGLMLANYCGANLWVPAIASVILAAIGTRFLPQNRVRTIPAISIQAAYLVWILFVALYARAFLGLIDVAVLGGLLIWFAVSVSKSSAIALISVQGLLLVINACQLLSAPLGSPVGRGIVGHIILRIACIVSTVLVIWRPPFMRREGASSLASDT